MGPFGVPEWAILATAEIEAENLSAGRTLRAEGNEHQCQRES
jgi:hypothetical protein